MDPIQPIPPRAHGDIDEEENAESVLRGNLKELLAEREVIEARVRHSASLIQVGIDIIEAMRDSDLDEETAKLRKQVLNGCATLWLKLTEEE